MSLILPLQAPPDQMYNHVRRQAGEGKPGIYPTPPMD
jgi:hypothetical protein